jgi:hypothetical protein
LIEHQMIRSLFSQMIYQTLIREHWPDLKLKALS